MLIVLLTLSKYTSFITIRRFPRNVDKLQPLLKWMDSHYGDPDLGLNDLADELGVSGRYLNNLFVKLSVSRLMPISYVYASAKAKKCS